jgi:hypothetical protein
MKNGLQYFYSIAVFIGVLFTAYLMMNSDGNSRVPLRALQAPTFRNEAAVTDPAITQLLEMEEVLAKLKKDKSDDLKRVPSQSKAKDRPSAE